MVSDSENAIKTLGRWEFDDKIHGDGLKEKGSAVGGNRIVGHVGVGHKGLSGLASGTTADKGGDKVLHMGPPVVLCKKKTGFKNAGVARGGGVMV